ncbi:LCP family protein [Actinomyces vulturis]|uniref:LCP family protein n=1 Tax=Actinomyces vulturis TaxID=1857645 RepID=UPI0009F316E3|nr:LCP family protein [Actinomyces vulturis]
MRLHKLASVSSRKSPAHAATPRRLRPHAHAQHAARELRFAWPRRFAYAFLALVTFFASGIAFAYHDMQSQVTRVNVDSLLGEDRPIRGDGTPLPDDDFEGHPVNIVVMGTDSRAGANNIDGSAGTEEVSVARSDTTMIVHLSADRTHMEVVSIPRDTMVSIPSCVTPDGTESFPQYGQFNSAFSIGAGEDASTQAQARGAACTIKTIEKMTDIYIDGFVIVDFHGLEQMVDSLGGVNVWVDEPINDDEWTGFVLPQGCQHLNGHDALFYARVRHGVGDGSDLQRINRQQNLMAAMMRTAMNTNILTNPDNLYSFARSALSTLTTSDNLGSLPTLAGLAMSAKDIGLNNILFITMPNVPDPDDENRVVPDDYMAERLWNALREDKTPPESTVSRNGESSSSSDESDDPSGTDSSTNETETAENKSPEESVPTAPLPDSSPSLDPAQQCV